MCARHLLAQAAVGRGDEPHVDRHVVVGADAADLAALEHAQQLGLQVERQLANLVEEHGAAGGRLEHALARDTAPVKAPRSWPNSSLSSRLGGIAPQSTTRNGLSRRGLPRWIASAETSLPVPVSPSSRMVASLLDALPRTSNTACMAVERPTMRPKRSSIARVRPESLDSRRTGPLPTSAARAPWDPTPLPSDIDNCGPPP